MTKASRWMAGLTGMLVVLAHAPVQAQHGHAASVTADGVGGGQLQVGFDFDVRPVARLQSVLGGLFNGTVPGLNDAVGDGVSSFPITDGTKVDIELMSIDEGLTWIFTNGTLATPGDRALLGTMPTLHNHPNYNLQVADDRTFAEARVSFRVLDSSPSPVYSTSDVRTFRASNGYLPPLIADVDPDANKALFKCQQTVGKTVRGFQSKAYQLLSKCLDAVVENHLGLESDSDKALKKCNLDEMDDKSLVGAIAKAKAKAVDKISKKCGILSDSSLPYTESQVYTHLGMAQCRAEEMAGATYNSAPVLLGEILESVLLGDDQTVIAAFPCMKASVEED